MLLGFSTGAMICLDSRVIGEKGTSLRNCAESFVEFRSSSFRLDIVDSLMIGEVNASDPWEALSSAALTAFTTAFNFRKEFRIESPASDGRFTGSDFESLIFQYPKPEVSARRRLGNKSWMNTLKSHRLVKFDGLQAYVLDNVTDVSTLPRK